MLAWAIGWQELLVLVIGLGVFAVPGWVFGGGALLFVGGRFIAKAPKATYWRSVATIAITGVASGLLLTLGLIVGGLAGGVYGLLWAALAAALGGLVASWLIVMGMFRTSFPRAILAWLPVLGVQLLFGAPVAALGTPALIAAADSSSKATCRMNLYAIRQTISIYRASNDNKWPANIDEIITQGQPPEIFRCPMVKADRRPAERQYDYFYRASDSEKHYDAIILCDYSDNHPDGSRAVVRLDGSVVLLTPRQFQAELAKPANAAFASALWQAEAPGAPTKGLGQR